MAPTGLTSLPAELHLQIASHLHYPYVSLLRCTSKYFYRTLENAEPRMTWEDLFQSAEALKEAGLKHSIMTCSLHGLKAIYYTGCPMCQL